MSYNGSGTFNINSAGQPVVTGTVITSTAFNLLTADLGTGLSTALTKDGQTTPTANIPMGTYKITGLGAGTVATDAVRLSQLQSGGTTSIITVSGTDTITGTVTPALTAYATGQQFSFVVAATNTTAVTLNVDGVGAKAVTRTGSVALVAGDMVTGQVVIVEYDGTRFQLINGNSFTNLKASGTLGVTGVATFTAAPVISSITNTGTLTLPTLTGTVGLATRTVQVFTSGSGTYTTPTGCKAISIRAVGGGAGGGGSGTGSSGGNGGNGGNTTFSTLTASGGTGGSGVGGSIGGAGGAASGGNVNIVGGFGGGCNGVSGLQLPGGNGGCSAFGGGGGITASGNNSTSASATNSGSGGAGASVGSTTGGGCGGGAGGYGELLISSPSATYSYAVGAGGSLGAAGTSGGNGGAGGSGLIIVMETY